MINIFDIIRCHTAYMVSNRMTNETDGSKQHSFSPEMRGFRLVAKKD